LFLKQIHPLNVLPAKVGGGSKFSTFKVLFSLGNTSLLLLIFGTSGRSQKIAKWNLTSRTVARESSIGGLYVCAGGGFGSYTGVLTFKFDKNLLIYSISYFNLGELGPPKLPRGDGLSTS